MVSPGCAEDIKPCVAMTAQELDLKGVVGKLMKVHVDQDEQTMYYNSVFGPYEEMLQ